jgi:hypothetical protein
MTEPAALQDTLATEHAAVHVLGVLGARTPQATEPGLFGAVTAAYAAHRARRDDLVRRITDLGADPVAAAATYELPSVPRTPAQVQVAAQGVEEATAQAYAALVAEATAEDREWAALALTDAAVRRVGFGADPEAFPGAPELSGA